MDLQAPGDAMQQVLRYLDAHAPDRAALARDRYACLAPYEGRPAEYGRDLVPIRPNAGVAEALAVPRLQRFVGVIYARDTERQSHYYGPQLGRQYDALIHIDRTTYLQPLRRP